MNLKIKTEKKEMKRTTNQIRRIISNKTELYSCLGAPAFRFFHGFVCLFIRRPNCLRHTDRSLVSVQRAFLSPDIHIHTHTHTLTFVCVDVFPCAFLLLNARK